MQGGEPEKTGCPQVACRVSRYIGIKAILYLYSLLTKFQTSNYVFQATLLFLFKHFLYTNKYIKNIRCVDGN